MCKGGQTLHFNKMVRMPKGILDVLILIQRLVEPQASKIEDYECRLIEQDLLPEDKKNTVATSRVAITINKCMQCAGI
jgi:hypothetical protein